jgi:hypothetical protein
VNAETFFAELKRRKVYSVAIAYVVAGWALAQGIAQVLPVFDIPNWVVRLLVVLIVLGFPVALTSRGFSILLDMESCALQIGHRNQDRCRRSVHFTGEVDCSFAI